MALLTYMLIILFAGLQHSKLSLIASEAVTTILHAYSTECVTNETQDLVTDAVQLLFPISINIKQINLETSSFLSGNDLDNVSFVVDGSCGNVMSSLANISHISYTPFAKMAENKILFNVYPTLLNIGDYLCVLMKKFSWNNLWIITQLELGEIAEIAQQNLNMCGIRTTLIYGNKTMKIQHNDTVVYLVLATLKHSQYILCQAYLEGLGYPNSMLILLDWYKYNIIVDNGTSLCSRAEIESILDNTLILQVRPIDNNSSTEDDNILANLTAIIPNMTNTSFIEYGIEAILVLYTAWNKSRHTGNNVNHELLSVNRPGLLGQLEFDTHGIRADSVVNLLQYREKNYVHVAIIDGDELQFLNNSGTLESESTILPGQNEIVVVPIAITIVFYILGGFGIIFTTVCLIFNILSRNTKVMKLASTNLNYLIIVGSYWLYINTFFIVIPERENHLELYEALVNVSFSTSISVTLCDGTIQGKMFRIFYIFYRPATKKKNIADWHIVIYVFVLVFIDLVIFIVAVSNPGFRVNMSLVPTNEYPQETNLLGVNTTHLIYVASIEINVFSIIHFLLIYGFRIFLDFLTAFLAFLSCLRVKRKVVNSSKSVMAIVYLNAIISVSNFTLFITTTDLFFPRVIVGCLSLILIPTNVLILTFIPKMIEVYKDPHVTSLFTSAPKNTQ